MRVVYVYPERLPCDNARGVQVVRTCAALARHTREVLLCVAGPAARDESLFGHYSVPPPANLTIIRTSRRLGPISSSAAFNWRLRRTLRSRGLCDRDAADTVLVTRHVQIPQGLAALGLPVIFEAHELLCEKPGVRRKVQRQEHRALIAAAGVAFLSEGLRRRCFQTLPFECPTAVIPSGTSAVCGAAASAAVDGPVRDLVYCGSTRYRWKGLHVLLEAVRQLEETPGGPRPRLHLIGRLEEPWSPDHPLIAALKNRGALELHGYIAPGQVAGWLRRFPVAVLPNSSEAPNSVHYTSPLKLLDYMAAGAAVVASDLPSVREIVGPDEALLVPPDDPQALAAGLWRVLADADLRRRLSCRAQHRVGEFTWERRAERFIHLFEAVRGDSPPPDPAPERRRGIESPFSPHQEPRCTRPIWNTKSATSNL